MPFSNDQGALNDKLGYHPSTRIPEGLAYEEMNFRPKKKPPYFLLGALMALLFLTVSLWLGLPGNEEARTVTSTPELSHAGSPVKAEVPSGLRRMTTPATDRINGATSPNTPPTSRALPTIAGTSPANPRSRAEGQTISISPTTDPRDEEVAVVPLTSSSFGAPVTSQHPAVALNAILPPVSHQTTDTTVTVAPPNARPARGNSLALGTTFLLDTKDNLHGNRADLTYRHPLGRFLHGRIGVGGQRLRREESGALRQATRLYRPGTLDTLFVNPAGEEIDRVTVDSVDGFLITDFRHTQRFESVYFPVGLDLTFPVAGIRLGLSAGVAYHLPVGGRRLVINEEGNYRDESEVARPQGNWTYDLGGSVDIPTYRWWNGGIRLTVGYSGYLDRWSANSPLTPRPRPQFLTGRLGVHLNL